MLLVVIYIAFISLGLPDSLLGSGWPVMRNVFNAPPEYAGFISIIVTGGTVISSLLSVRLIARFGAAKVVAVSVLLTALALGGFSYSRHFVFLLILAFPLGLGGGSIDAALNNFVALHFRASHMNFLHASWGVGATLSPLVMFFWLSRNGAWRLGYRTVSIIQLCIAALMFASFPLWKKTEKKSPAAEADGEKTMTDGQKPAPSAQAGIWDALRLPGAAAAVASFFAYCAFETTTGLWGPTFLVTIKQLSPETAARWISSYYMGIMAGRFLSGFLSRVFSAGRMIKIGCAVIFISCIILSLPSGSVYLAGFLLLGLGCAPIFPSLIHLTPVHFGASNSQAIVGLQMAGAYLGATTMPALFGKIASAVSFNLYTPYIALFFFIMLIAIVLLKKMAGGRSSNVIS
jgi:fucose permease